MADDPIPLTEEKVAEEERLRRNYGPSREVPATYVNTFYVTASSGILRVAFGETSEEPVGVKFRVTVAMPLEDARELARVVGDMVREVEEEEAAEKPGK